MEAANAAADELRPRFGDRALGVRSKSTPTDLVSDADLAAESAIRKVIGRRRPDDAIIGEEGGETGAGELRWVVDPLDGTVNFLFGIPQFAVSVACEDASGGLAGVVLDPNREECFTATRAGEPKLNGVTIAASDRDDLATAMVATGFGYDASVRERQAAVLAGCFRGCGTSAARGRPRSTCAGARVGATTPTTSAGFTTGTWPAAGSIAERAGLLVRKLPANGSDPWGVVVAPAALIDELYALVSDPPR